MGIAIVLALSLTALMLLAVPVAFALIMAVVITVLWEGGINLMILPQQVMGGIDNLLLLAIPFFLLAGDLMTAGGMTDRLLALTNAILGRFRGGLAMSNVASAVFMSGISGSAVADTSALGRVLIPAMIKEGYGPGFSAALTAAANVVGPIIPPSIVFVMIGVLTNLSITQLFLAGAVPGLLYGAVMMAMAWGISRRRGYPVHGKASATEVWRALRAAIWALLMPVLIIGGIRSGVFNVTECSAVAVLYALFVGGVVYRQLTPAILLQCLVRTARTTAVVMIVIGAAQSVSWLLAYQNIPQQLADLMVSATQSPWVFLLLVNVFLLLVGTFLENGPALVMLVPVLYPIAAKLGIDPIHFSIVVSLNLVIGLITPPVAICLSIGAVIAQIPQREATREVIPFFIAAIAVLMVITYVPQVSLWLPHRLGGH
ncbi:MAG TPA: TRAP transporter large permease [Lautropia sp.]|nr:TRAP transporter large permease [Lautropia sp.]